LLVQPTAGFACKHPINALELFANNFSFTNRIIKKNTHTHIHT
jgi:hypothetical protein